MANRTSGLDFSDKKSPMDALAAHPDVLARAPSTSNLQRNKTERHRLQGLMRSGSNTSNTNTSESGVKVPNKMKDEKLMDRWHTWLINGGQSKLIFGIYIFLHLIVIALGFLNYQLKDNQTIVRSIVGLGFGEFPLIVAMYVPDRIP
jgi:NADPH oxidase